METFNQGDQVELKESDSSCPILWEVEYTVFDASRDVQILKLNAVSWEHAGLKQLDLGYNYKKVR